MEVKIKSYKKYGALILATLIIIVVLLVTFTPNLKAFTMKDVSPNGLESYTASSLAYGLGCGNIYKQPEAGTLSKEIPQQYYLDNKDYRYIPSAPTAIPIYGYLSERGMDKSEIKFYDKETYTSEFTEQYILRTMWDNNNITLWYNPETISKKELKLIESLDSTYPNTILVLPWPEYDGAKIPAGRTFAYSKLGYSQSCTFFSLDVLVEFAKFAKDNPIVHGEKPKIAKLDIYGRLPEFS